MPLDSPQSPPETFNAALRSHVRAIIKVSGAKAYTAILLMFLSSLAEGIGIAMFLPALQFAGLNVLSDGLPKRYMSFFSELIAPWGIRVPLAFVLAAIACVLVLRTAFIRLQYVYVVETVYRFVATTDVRLYQSVVLADWSEISRQRSSRFTHLLSHEHERLIIATHDFLLLISGSLTTLLYVAIALILSPRLTFIFTVSGLLLALLLRRMTAKVHATALQASMLMMTLSGEALEHLQNLKAVITYDAQQRDIAMFSRRVTAASETYLKAQRHEAAANFWFEGGSLLLVVVILYFALAFHAGAVVNILLLLAVFARIMPKLAGQYALAQSVATNLPAHSRIQAAISEMTLTRDKDRSDESPLTLRRSLRFRNVSFRYTAAERDSVRSLSLEMPAGMITAIVGASGVGKSTIADLAMGLLFPKEGQIFVDEVSLSRSRTHAWRKNVGYVAQDTVLFHDSVRANLLWANPSATDQEIGDALRAAAADFVFDLPNGLDTILGERGSNLSHGERQRIALARALVCDRSVLVLDEATNNLDRLNEQRVLQSVTRLKGKLTTIMITHRLAAVRVADLIHVIESGELVESGTWNALVNQTGSRLHDLISI